jgi:transposase
VGKANNYYFCVMNSTEIFSLALGLSEPWFVEDVSFTLEGNKRILDIKISHKKGSFFTDNLGKSTIYDHVERTWKHLNFFQHECYLHCNVPRLVSQAGKVTQVEVPWARAGSERRPVDLHFYLRHFQCF